jgi:hypothetical protein
MTMLGAPLQGYAAVEIDYRHEQLMALVAQTPVAGRPRNAWIHDLLGNWRRHHHGRRT